ncbi:MAG: MmcQ/YjbR family DNA-binding protein [Candidatus Dormibacterales bacterium]
MVTINEVRAVAQKLPRSYEVLVGGRVKFRVGRMVFLSFSRDETVMGFAFPKEEREWLIGGSPDKFMHPTPSDMRYHWVLARLSTLELDEMRGLVIDAWRMVVPKSLAFTYPET